MAIVQVYIMIDVYIQLPHWFARSYISFTVPTFSAVCSWTGHLAVDRLT